MSKDTLDILDKVLIKCMDFLESLSTFTEDLKIEDLHKSDNLTKSLRQDIFYSLVVYDPMRFIGVNKLQC